MSWLNSDDKYHHDALFKVAYLFDSSPGVEWLTGHPTFWGKDGNLIRIEPVLPTYSRNDFWAGKYNKPFIQQESTFWKRSLWDRAGGCLRTDLDYAGDLELWIRFFRFAQIYSVDTFVGGYRSHGNQKACLFMDRYVDEAEKVIEQDKKLHSELDDSISSDAPCPLELEIQGYKEYLSRQESTNCLPERRAATEEAFQYLLKMSSSAFAEEETRKKMLVDRIEALQASFSWRVTKPLRWLSARIRGSARS